jgi:hypothetical protein
MSPIIPLLSRGLIGKLDPLRSMNRKTRRHILISSVSPFNS